MKYLFLAQVSAGQLGLSWSVLGSAGLGSKLWVRSRSVPQVFHPLWTIANWEVNTQFFFSDTDTPPTKFFWPKQVTLSIPTSVEQGSICLLWRWWDQEKAYLLNNNIIFLRQQGIEGHPCQPHNVPHIVLIPVSFIGSSQNKDNESQMMLKSQMML